MSQLQALAAATSRRRFAATDVDITISSDLATCRGAWRELQGRGIATPFQTYEWLAAWQRDVGAGAGIRPLIVVGRRCDGSALFILPFGMIERHGCRVLTWLSAPHANYGCGMFDPAFLEWSEDAFDAAWQQIISLLPRVDAIVLSNQPERLGRFDNPLLGLRTCASADRSHVLDLSRPFPDIVEEKFSSRSRRRRRQIAKKLRELPECRIAAAFWDRDVRTATRTVFALKAAQLAKRGIPSPFTPSFQRFFDKLAASECGERGLLRCSFLEIEGDIVAVNFGAVYNGVYHGLITAMIEERYTQLSIGACVLDHAIETAAGEDLIAFDFSSGDADYKTRWADRTIHLFETHIALTAKGRLYCLAARAALFAKRRIKRSPLLWSWAKTLRAARSGRLALPRQ